MPCFIKLYLYLTQIYNYIHACYIFRAIDENKETLAQFLIRSGCDVESPRRLGPGGQGAEMASEQQAPLHLCCAWGLINVIQVYPRQCESECDDCTKAIDENKENQLT